MPHWATDDDADDDDDYDDVDDGGCVVCHIGLLPPWASPFVLSALATSSRNNFIMMMMMICIYKISQRRVLKTMIYLVNIIILQNSLKINHRYSYILNLLPHHVCPDLAESKSMSNI